MAQPLSDQIDATIAATNSEIADHQAVIDGLSARLRVLQRAKAILVANPELQSLIDRLDLDVRVPQLSAVIESIRQATKLADVQPASVLPLDKPPIA